MKAFMDKDFLLSSETAKHLYHDYVSSKTSPRSGWAATTTSGG